MIHDFIRVSSTIPYYDNAVLKIKLQYPFEWIKSENNTSVTFSPIKENNLDKLSIAFTISVENIQRNENLINYLNGNSYFKSLLNSKNYFIDSSETIYGYPAKKIFFVNDISNNEEYREFVIWFIKDAKAYTINYQAKFDQYYRYLPFIQGMINSFVDLTLKPQPLESGGISVGINPKGIAVNPSTNMIYTSNSGLDSISVIDGNIDQVIDTIPVGFEFHPYDVAINPATNKIYVSNFNSKTLSVIDGNTHNVISNITVGIGPYRIAINPETNMIYVSNGLSGSVSVINGDTSRVIHTITSKGSSGIGVYNDYLYIAGRYSNSLDVIDIKNNYSKVARIEVGKFPVNLAINQLTGLIYVLNMHDNSISVIDGSINPTSNINNVLPSIKLGNKVKAPYDIALNSNTNRIYVTDTLTANVSVIDLVKDNQIISNIPISTYNNGIQTIADNEENVPQNTIDINPNTNMIYVADIISDIVSIIDGNTNNLVTRVNFTSSPSKAGNIYCNNNKMTDNFSKVSIENLKCEAKANNGFVFSSWSGNVTSHLSNNYIIDIPAVSRNGHLIANFANAPLPISIPNELLALLLGVIPTSAAIPSFISWLFRRKQRKHLRSYRIKIDSINKEYLFNKKKYEKQIDELNVCLAKELEKGNIDHSDYNVLRDRISDYQRRIDEEARQHGFTTDFEVAVFGELQKIKDNEHISEEIVKSISNKINEGIKNKDFDEKSINLHIYNILNQNNYPQEHLKKLTQRIINLANEYLQ
jgi:YVTN family beta-propeller protein